MPTWGWIVIVLVAVIGVIIIAIKTAGSRRTASSSSSGSTGSTSSTGTGGTRAPKQYSPIWGVLGLVGVMLTLGFWVWAVSGIFSFTSSAMTQFASTPPCATATYSHLVWEGWLEPGKSQHVYDVVLPKGKDQIKWTVGLDHTRHPVFHHVQIPGVETGWAKARDAEQLFAKREGPLELLVAPKDTRTYAKVYLLDL